MDTETKDLAKKLLIMKVEAHINSHATGMPQQPVIAQWYAECVSVAQSIKAVSH